MEIAIYKPEKAQGKSFTAKTHPAYKNHSEGGESMPAQKAGI